MAETLSGELIEVLNTVGFVGDVLDNKSTRTVYSTDNSIYQVEPKLVVIPDSTQDLVKLVEANNTLKQPFALVARGGGTGTNGQSLTEEVVIDFRRRMNKIISIDVDNLSAVVQPGVVLDELNSRLKSSGLYFAAHVATGSRATIGGMVATDAAGKGSMVHGRTNNHILALEAVLGDGTLHKFMSKEKNHKSSDDSQIHDELTAVAESTNLANLPKVPRGFSGYNLGDAFNDELDVTKLLCGSEGTLALISEVVIKLTPLPTKKYLAVVAYNSFEESLDASLELRKTNPSAIECIDSHTLASARVSPYFKSLNKLIKVQQKSVLILEYEDQDGFKKVTKLLENSSNEYGLTEDPQVISNIWQVRKDSVGLLAQPIGTAASVAFVEDCAVPPEHLSEFVSKFREILDSHNLVYGMFGHADVGCIHVRPALDLMKQSHRDLVRTVSDQVSTLVASFGGVLWSEHGQGFRGEFNPLPADLIEGMRKVKEIFDPNNILNPRKMYVPINSNESLRLIDEVSLRAEKNIELTTEDRNEFSSALNCNGNGICHHWGEAEMMCPSFKVTLDPRLSPKGRADLLRAWLHNKDDVQLADEVAESLHQCLSCNACTGRCPVQVDIPEMKSRFFEQYKGLSSKQKIQHTMLSNFESLIPKMNKVPGNGGQSQKLINKVVGKVLGLIDLPVMSGKKLSQILKEQDVAQLSAADLPSDVTVVVLAESFTSYLDSEVLGSTLKVLKSMGEVPALSAYVPTGKFDHVKGRRKHFASAVQKQSELINSYAAAGVPVIVIEPAVSLLYLNEYKQFDTNFPSEHVQSLPSYLNSKSKVLTALVEDKKYKSESAKLFSHCSELALTPENDSVYIDVLAKFGFESELQATSCCGMAGVFGHEKDNQLISSDLFEQFWLPKIESTNGSILLASGYSCRSQAKRFGHKLQHPIQIIADCIED